MQKYRSADMQNVMLTEMQKGCWASALRARRHLKLEIILLLVIYIHALRLSTAICALPRGCCALESQAVDVT